MAVVAGRRKTRALEKGHSFALPEFWLLRKIYQSPLRVRQRIRERGKREKDGRSRGAERRKIIQVIYLTFSSFATSHIGRIVMEEERRGAGGDGRHVEGGRWRGDRPEREIVEEGERMEGRKNIRGKYLINQSLSFAVQYPFRIEPPFYDLFLRLFFAHLATGTEIRGLKNPTASAGMCRCLANQEDSSALGGEDSSMKRRILKD